MFSFRVGLVGAIALAGVVSFANVAIAVPVTPAENPINGNTWSLDPAAGLVKSVSEPKDDFGDLGDASVITALKSAAWFNLSYLVQVGGGDCAPAPDVSCTETPNKQGTYSGVFADLFAVHIGGSKGGTVLAFLYDDPISFFKVSGFANGVSWIRAYCTDSDGCHGPDDGNTGNVPLPGAVWLMGTVLAGGFGAMQLRRRRRTKAA